MLVQNSIFDRYGKLLKELTPNSGGWNGLYIGQPMPSDYWFVVEYRRKYLKKYKSHFSLKDKNKSSSNIELFCFLSKKILHSFLSSKHKI
jgi:hypothetical protein